MAERYDTEPQNSAAEAVMRAAQMAAILEISSASFTGREVKAFGVMSHLYSMARLKEQGARHRFGMEILQYTNRVLPMDDPDNAQFFGSVQNVVITMQEMPSWFHEISETDAQLVDEYVTIWWIQAGMGTVLGISGASVSGTGSKMVGAAVKGAASSAVPGFAGRVGAATSAAGSTLGKAFTGGYAARASVMGFVVGTMVYTTLDDDRERIGKEITRRYQEHQISADRYKKAFGAGTPLPERYVFKPDGVP